MPITTGSKALVDAATARIRTLSVEQAAQRLHAHDAVFVDIRDVRELEREGLIPGAVHAPRGMLEFWVDPQSPYYREIFGSGKEFILYCAGGWRSALATATLQDMGLEPLAHVAGGFTAWKQAGQPVEQKKPKAAA